MASGPITSWEIDGETWRQCQTLFLGAPKSLLLLMAAMKLKDAYSLEEKFDQPQLSLVHFSRSVMSDSETSVSKQRSN